MIKKLFLILILGVSSINIAAQDTIQITKKRLDFAKTYFEIGSNYLPSFTGKRIQNDQINSFQHSESILPYINWGGFHFHGHAEFYVSIPLGQLNINKNDQTDYKFHYATITGFRFLPWAYQPKKIRPYAGFSWSALDFKQILKPNEDQPTLSKNYELVYDAGFLYGFKDFTGRLGISYFQHNNWNYPISKTNFQNIETPNFSIQLGLIYSFESSKNDNQKLNDRWNSYPTLSKLNYKDTTFGDFFLAIGPSSSFSLQNSTYNTIYNPYLDQKIGSNAYWDIAIGYQFNKFGFFTALSYRNPIFEQAAYGLSQTINKKSLTLEVNKFITDYTGFAPYIGINIAFDHIQFTEKTEHNNKALSFKRLEPGLSFGWDITPGKTDEYLILRTNLRWYPFSSFEVDNKTFDFSQFEYNLIQVVFYPGRYFKSKRIIYE